MNNKFTSSSSLNLWMEASTTTKKLVSSRFQHFEENLPWPEDRSRDRGDIRSRDRGDKRSNTSEEEPRFEQILGSAKLELSSLKCNWVYSIIFRFVKKKVELFSNTLENNLKIYLFAKNTTISGTSVESLKLYSKSLSRTGSTRCSHWGFSCWLTRNLQRSDPERCFVCTDGWSH